MHTGEGIFVSNRAFFCRTGLFCVEPCILLSNRAFFVSNECYNGSHPFRYMSIGRPIPEIKLFQTLTLKFQGQGHGWGQRARSYNWPSIISPRFHFTSIRPTIPEIELFQNLT